jgi:carotenoid cleavage dioxygenase
LVHDFAVTCDFVIFIVCPVTISMERARAGGPPIAWEPEKFTHVGVLPRNGRSADVRWQVVPAAMVWHTLNAFNDRNTIGVDVCRQHAAAFPRADGRSNDDHELQQRLTRWTIDRETFASSRLSDVVCEYPRFDERRAGLSVRHAYFACAGGPGTGDLFHRGIAHFDHVTRQMAVHHAGPDCSVAEPVFVSKAPDADEGGGYLLSVIFDERRNRSHLAIFDALHVERGPIARAFLDHRVPGGFHGIWREHIA